MENNEFNTSSDAASAVVPENAPSHSSDDSLYEPGKSLEAMASELNELAVVPTEVLADWVAARGRCLWETTFGEPPEWSGEEDPDRELAQRLCAGCPVRSECLEFELRVAGDQTLGVWGGLNRDDRLALHKVWRWRRREEIERLTDEEGERR